MELNELTEKIIGCAYEVSNTLGSGFPESVYEKALHYQTIKTGLQSERQYQMKVLFDGILVGEFFADLLVEEKVLVEIKAVRLLDELHTAQAMNYLKASSMPICLLINFGRPKIEIRRFVLYDVWKENQPRLATRRRALILFSFTFISFICGLMTKAVVAMSGGVDSSVAAALLKEQGYDVIGMMLRLWSEPGKEDSNRCCTPDAMAQARRVAAKLDIPFYVIDAKDIFHNTVVQYFLDGYARGETPNPCLICNRQIRWTFLLDHALALGAYFMATGHYVRKQTTDKGHQLLRAVDRSKDQSYVLHVLNQDKLAKALFPVGDYPKPEIRAIAEKHGLPTASRKDSQDLCFLAGDDYRNFLQRNAAEILRPGEIVTSEGRSIGEHNGLANYTIGQRKGLSIASSVPLYVLGKNAGSNTLIVGTQEELGSSELTARDVNWLSGEIPGEPFHADVKSRYTAKEAAALVTPINEDQVQVRFEAPQRDITAGQAAVFYQGDVLIGGGIIIL